MIQDHLVNSKEHVRFRLSVNNDQYEQIMAYGELLQHINKDDEQEVLWKYKRILGHQGPLTADDEGYNGSSYNVQVEWENGEITYEPLSVIAADDPPLDGNALNELPRTRKSFSNKSTKQNYDRSALHHASSTDLKYPRTMSMQSSWIGVMGTPSGRMPRSLSLTNWTTTILLRILVIARR